ncbi:MAG TPA: proline/glycine betaine ABC transporter permease [Dehalococcoidales bacterium]|nr:proline/glycine betaine ABC transporter permease [Dehalococcoidales bacterium]
MFDFPELVVIPLGDWINTAVEWLTINLADFFNVITIVIREPLVQIEHFLWWIPWWLMIIILVGTAWRFAGYKIALVSLFGMVFIGVMGLWDHTMTTMAIIVTAVAVSVVIGIPLGILGAKNDRFESIMRPILDGMQTMPSFVYLIPAVFFFGLGKVPAVVATVIYAVPPCIRLTNLGIRQVPREIVEAGKAFGSTGMQLLFKIQLPLARPSIMAGINQTIMMALAMVVIASMIGASGLGLEVLRGIERLDVGRGFLAGVGIVILAIMIDRIGQSFGRVNSTRRPSF